METYREYAIVEFTISWFDAGKKCYPGEVILWEGVEPGEWGVLPDGEMGSEKTTVLRQIKDAKVYETEAETDYFIPEKDHIGVVDLHISDGGMLHDYETDGEMIFEGWENDIFKIAKSIPRPAKNQQQRVSFLTLWEFTVEFYTSYDSFYPEIETFAEMIGLITKDDLAKLAKRIERKNGTS